MCVCVCVCVCLFTSVSLCVSVYVCGLVGYLFCIIGLHKSISMHMNDFLDLESKLKKMNRRNNQYILYRLSDYVQLFYIFEFLGRGFAVFT